MKILKGFVAMVFLATLIILLLERVRKAKDILDQGLKSNTASIKYWFDGKVRKKKSKIKILN